MKILRTDPKLAFNLVSGLEQAVEESLVETVVNSLASVKERQPEVTKAWHSQQMRAAEQVEGSGVWFEDQPVAAEDDNPDQKMGSSHLGFMRFGLFGRFFGHPG